MRVGDSSSKSTPSSSSSSSSKDASSKPQSSSSPSSKDASSKPQSSSSPSSKDASSKPQPSSSPSSKDAAAKPATSSSEPAKPASNTSASTAPANKDQISEPSKPAPVDISGAPSKPELKPPSDTSVAQVKRLDAGDQIKVKTSASANAGQANAQAESSVAVRKNDKGKYDVSADRATAASVGLNVPPEPPAPGAHATTAPQAEPGRTDQPRGPIIDTAPKPEQGPGQSTSPRPGGVVSIPGGPSILTPPGIGIATKPETKPAPSGGLGLDGPLLDRPPAQNGQSGTPAAEDKGPDVEIGARTGSTVIYTVDTPEKAARAAEILMSGKVASPNEAAALNSALSAQEVRYSSTAKAAGNGVTADEAGTTALKVKYQNGRVSGTELKSEFEVNGAEDFHGVGLKAGDKLSFTTIDDGGAISHRSIAEVSGSAAAPGAGILNNVGGDRTEYKFTSQGMEVNSFLTSQQGVNIPFGPGSVAASVELEDRIYHSAPA